MTDETTLEERREKAREYSRSYYQKNKTKVSVWGKEYYQKNKDIIIKRTEEYRKSNPDKNREWQKKYREVHKDRVKESMTNHIKNNPMAKQDRYYRKRNQAIETLGNKCVICGINEDLTIYIKNGSPIEGLRRKYALYTYCIKNTSEAINHCELLCQTHRNIRRELSDEGRERMREARSKTIFPAKDTDIERILQNVLANLDIPFIKHRTIRIGRFFHQVDLFVEPNICIEADGNYWHTKPGQIEKDLRDTKTLEEQGYKVVRFWEKDIKNRLGDVIDRIRKEVL